MTAKMIHIPLRYKLPYTMDNSSNGSFFPYRLVKQIAQGSEGIVYKVTDARGEKHASKEITTKNWNDDNYKRFSQEMQSLQKTNCEHLMYPEEVYKSPTALYLIFPLGNGDMHKFAKQYNKQVGPLPIEKVHQLMVQAIDGILALHRVGMCHRDIKPSNFILLVINNRWVVKVTDFETSITVEDINNSGIQSRWGNRAYGHPIWIYDGSIIAYYEVDAWPVCSSIFSLLIGVMNYGNFVDETLGKNKIPEFFNGLRQKVQETMNKFDKTSAIRYMLNGLMNGVQKSQFSLKILKQKMETELTKFNNSNLHHDNSDFKSQINEFNQNEIYGRHRHQATLNHNIFRNNEINNYLDVRVPKASEGFFWESIIELRKKKNENAIKSKFLKDGNLYPNMIQNWWPNINDVTNRKINQFQNIQISSPLPSLANSVPSLMSTPTIPSYGGGYMSNRTNYNSSRARFSPMARFR